MVSAIAQSHAGPPTVIKHQHGQKIGFLTIFTKIVSSVPLIFWQHMHTTYLNQFPSTKICSESLNISLKICSYPQWFWAVVQREKSCMAYDLHPVLIPCLVSMKSKKLKYFLSNCDFRVFALIALVWSKVTFVSHFKISLEN